MARLTSVQDMKDIEQQSELQKVMLLTKKIEQKLEIVKFAAELQSDVPEALKELGRTLTKVLEDLKI